MFLQCNHERVGFVLHHGSGARIDGCSDESTEHNVTGHGQPPAAGNLRGNGALPCFVARLGNGDVQGFVAGNFHAQRRLATLAGGDLHVGPLRSGVHGEYLASSPGDGGAPRGEKEREKGKMNFHNTQRL